MGLREIAQADMTAILSDGAYGPAWAITITDPDGNSTPDGFTGLSNDIAQIIDPDTGQAVSGRLASAALSISALTEAGFELPVGIADTTCKPWIIAFDDINGNPFRFKVAQSNPDRALGIVVCVLELYCD